MKKGRIFAKILTVVTLVAVVLTCTAIFAACNKNKTRGIADIFKSRASYGEFTGFKTEFILPAGWEVYTNSTTQTSPSDPALNSDVGYIPEIDAFIVCLTQGTSKILSVVKCGDNTNYNVEMKNGMMFGPQQGICALRYKDGLIACLFGDGAAGVYDAATGREVLSRTKVGAQTGKNAPGYTSTSGGRIDDIIKILSGGLIAVHYNYDHNGASDYTSIFRPQYTGTVGNRGELVCRVRNTGSKLSCVNGFDDRYVSVSGDKNGEYMFRIPDHASSNGAENLESSPKGSFSTNNNTNYTDESTYIGGGRFYVSQDWEVGSSDDYTYYIGSKYIKCRRGIYSVENDSFNEINSNKIFNNLTNNYYSDSKAGIDTRSYLKDGYTYVSYGITVIESNGKKIGLYDQFILNSNLNIVMSLTGNYGITLEDQAKDDVSFFDLIMCGVDGLYYVPMQPSQVNLYDAKGNVVGHNDRSNVTRQELNSNIMVAETPDPSNSSSRLYGAYDRYGNPLVPFEYTMLSSYRGLYTIGIRYGRKDTDGESTSTRYLRLIGPNGTEITEAQVYKDDGTVGSGKPFDDIAYSGAQSVSTAIYKTGCYMFRVKSGTQNGKPEYTYGIRNFDPSINGVIMPAIMSAGCVLYAPSASPSDVFVFQKVTDSSDVTYIIHRLI